jgi:nucleoside-diphosphate-sugar epimerase
MRILVTGGAGYLGSVLSMGLLEDTHHVRVLDSLLYGGTALIPMLGHPRFECIVADMRDDAALGRAVEGVDAVVHLAAIVGDPACARHPELARAVNADASAALVRAAEHARVGRFVFASTCSNYGRMASTSVLATEDHALRPLSLYAETKVAIERQLLERDRSSPTKATVLRFATLFGLSPRMRFDLTVNEFARDMLVHRKLVVYGETFWRPYVHVRDAARAVMAVLAADAGVVAGQVFNVGDTAENYRKLDLVDMIRHRVGDADVQFVSVAEDPRDYKVSFERIRSMLGFVPLRHVPDGIDEIANAIEWRMFDNLDDARYSNIGRALSPAPSPTVPGAEDACVPSF